MEAILALEDGTWYRGLAAGAEGEALGEVVFNTSMTGYQEVLTDPSYAGQIVTMTCPEIGNYGVSDEDVESRGVHVAGFIIRQESAVASNWRSDGTIREYLSRHKVVAIAGIDTRELTRRLRSAGVMRGDHRHRVRAQPAGALGEGGFDSNDGRLRPREGRHDAGGVRLARGGSGGVRRRAWASARSAG